MKDRFEVFVKAALLKDSVVAPDMENVWTAVDDKLRVRKTRRRIVYFSIAASVLLLAGLGIVFYPGSSPAADYCIQVSEELNETNFYYTGLIEQKYRQLEVSGKIDKVYFQVYFDEMDQLDRDYQNYRDEIRKYGFQEDIVRAMVENQRRKLMILNRLIQEIQKVKSYENRKING
jgi:hypothetical protein